MDEEKKITPNEGVSGNGSDIDNDYLAAIKELKENTVSKDEYEKLVAKNKQLLDAYVHGQAPEKVEAEVTQTVEELREKAFKDGQTNLEYVTNALALRNKVIEEGGVDPFVPNGYQIKPTEEDIQAAQRVADVLQQCVDYAEGDSEVFTNELQRRTIDIAPMHKRR